MAQSSYKTTPMLRGSLAAASPYNALMARTTKRIRPYQLGAMVAADGSSITEITLWGQGDLAAADYVIFCDEVSYGNTSLWIPDTARIRKIAAGGIDVTDDKITLEAAVTVVAGEYCFCLGADSYTASVVQFDGSDLTLYDSHGGTVPEQNANGYLSSGDGGHFRGWVTPDTTTAADLLITNSSDQMESVIPFYALGPSIAT